MKSNFLNKNKWSILCILGLASHQVIEEYIRPYYQELDAIQFLLGVAPNFIAAALIFPFAGMALWKLKTGQNLQVQNQWFWRSNVISTIGLIIWEFMQLKGNLIFDYWDIVFTLIGSIMAIFIYIFVR